VSAEFDPYHKWLAIPPKLQPPNHYRLLGVELFESDLDVIDAAANQRMAYVQGLASGEYGELSQRLLNELAAARVCLMDPDEKAAYDATLKEASEATEEKPKQADRQAVDEKEPIREAAEDASQQADDVPTPPSTPIAPPKAEPQSSADPPATRNAQTPPPPPPSKVVNRERAASGPPAIDSGATAPPPVSAKRQIEAAVSVVESSEGKPASRAKQLRQDHGNPALVVAGSVVAVLTLLGAIYVATGQWRNVPEPKPSISQRDSTHDRRSQRPSGTDEPKKPAQSVSPRPKEQPNQEFQPSEPATDFAASKPKLQNEGPPYNGDPVAETKVAMEGGNIDQALTRLEQVRQSGDTQERTWARKLLEEIDSAYSDYNAQKLLEKLSDEQLERLAEGKDEVEVEGDFRYPVLRQRFNETVKENVHVVLERRRKGQTDAKVAKSDKPNPSDDAMARGEDMLAKPEPAQPKQMDVGPTELLKKRSLTKRDDYWVLEGDDDLKERVVELGRQERDYKGADATLREAVAVVRNLHTRLATAERNGQRALFEQARMAYDNAGPQYHEILLSYMKARSDFTVAYLKAANRAEELLGKYRGLADNPNVATALGELGAASNKLGPTPIFRQNQGRIGKHEGELLGDRALGFFGDDEDDNVFHVHVIVNDCTSAPFALRPRAEYSLVPEEVLRDAGIETESDQKVERRIGGVRFETSKVVIPSLRIGKFVSRDVEVYVLPSHIRRFKGFLADDAFPNFRIDVKRDENVATLRATR